MDDGCSPNPLCTGINSWVKLLKVYQGPRVRKRGVFITVDCVELFGPQN